MKKILSTLLLSIFILSGFAQQNPPKLKWKQIKTEHTTVIFPTGIDAQAQKVAKQINLLHKYESKTLGGKITPLPIILFNQTAISNGYAALGPKRSVWYTTPMQEVSALGSSNWLSLLAVHEYRHIAQFSSSNRNITRMMHFLWGSNGWSLGQYSIPSWFFEGDAVCTETAMSNEGRGRIPAFTMPIRTQVISGDIYKYDKAKLGSYKNYVPNRYPLGYLMTSHTRDYYGLDIWDKTLKRVSYFPFSPYAFSKSLKKKTGKNERSLYDEAMAKYDSLWKEQLEGILETDAKIVNKGKPKRDYTSYSEPKFLNDGSIICLKTTLSETPKLVQIQKDGTEILVSNTYRQILANPSNGKLAFVHPKPDKRWGAQDYSDISIFDIGLGTTTVITKKGKYFAPALSPDGKKISVVKYGTNMIASIVILDIDGRVLNTILPENYNFYRTPTWSADNENIVFTSSGNNGSALISFNIKTKIKTILIPEKSENIGRPIFWNNYVLYNSPISGIGNIYAVNLETKERFQVTSRKFGAYNPAVQNNKLVYQDYTKEGYRVAKMNLDTTKWIKVSDITVNETDTYTHLIEQENTNNLLDTLLLPTADFEVKKYHALKGFKIYNWGILPSGDGAKFELSGKNLLNTVSATAYSQFNNTERTWTNTTKINFSKYYPIFNLALTRQGRRSEGLNIEMDTIKQFWHENVLSAGVSVPLNLSTPTYYRNLSFNTNYNLIKAEDKQFRLLDSYANKAFTTVETGLAFYSLKHKALRDINSKLGIIANMDFNTAPLTPSVKGHIFMTSVTGYLPGVLKNHSVKLKLAFEKRRGFPKVNNGDYYYFAGNVAAPRGFEKVFSDQASLASIDYVFPLWYPDFNLGSLLYIKRFRGGFFYDFGTASALNGFSKSDNFFSSGAELHVEFHLFRLEMPFEVGVRFNYFPESDEDYSFEFVTFGVDF